MARWQLSNQGLNKQRLNKQGSNKQRWVIVLCMIVFFAVICAMYLSGAISPGSDEDAGSIAIVCGDQQENQQESQPLEADLDYLKTLESETFKTVVRSSGKKPREAEYTGVLLSTFLDALGFDLEEKRQILISGTDGYAVAVTVKEVFEPGNVYIAYALDGEALKPKRAGGEGPYQLIIRKDFFSLRWCKYVNRVEIQ